MSTSYSLSCQSPVLPDFQPKFGAEKIIKDYVHPVLCISSAHNKGGPSDINIAQILHLSNFFELKRTVYIHLQV